MSGSVVEAPSPENKLALPEGVTSRTIWEVHDSLSTHQTLQFDTAEKAIAWNAVHSSSCKALEMIRTWEESDLKVIAGTHVYFFRHPPAAAEQFFLAFRRIVDTQYVQEEGSMSKEQILNVLDVMWSMSPRLGVKSSPSDGYGDKTLGVLLALGGFHSSLGKVFERFQFIERDGLEFLGGTPMTGVVPEAVDLNHPLAGKTKYRKAA